MTANKRIILNIIATYGRSLFALLCGLFTARWVLMALGKVDYGLYGVVGGLTVFISFINNILATAIGRFYAFSIGEARANPDRSSGLEKCRQWFNIALVIHLIVPMFLILIGYPVGVWMVRNFLVIPPDRVDACVWVFRFVCVSCFVGMLNVPFQAMYTAKQYIAELTIYGFAQSLLNVVALYYMVTHPCNWLMGYAAWICFITTAPQIIICVRAFLIFPECKINKRYFWSWKYYSELGKFAFWQVFGILGHVFKGQGVALVVNKYFGPGVNAAMAVANQVSAHTMSLVSAMQGAFTPAITQAFGEGDFVKARKMSYRTCKFGLLLVLLFVIPLSIELTPVFRLWLKNPPEYSVGLCWCMLMILVIDKSALGHMIAIYATGKIAGYQFFSGGALVLTLPTALIFAELGFGVYSIGAALVFSMVLCVLGRIWYARKYAMLSLWYWINCIVLRVVGVSALIVSIGIIPRLLLPESFMRICLTSLICLLAYLPLTWIVVLDCEERIFVSQYLHKLMNRLRTIK